jgi:cytoskeletal protein RodZ
MKLLPKSLLEIKAEMKILNILVFAVAFILITVGMIFLNSIYSNIFKFDFSTISSKDTVAVSSTVSQNDPTTEINKQLDKKAEPVESKDSSKINLATDSVVSSPPKLNAAPQVIPAVNKVNNVPDTKAAVTEQNKAKQVIEEQTVLPQKNENEILISNNFTKSEVDTIYQKWIKQTAKLYESMDPKKAALIIRNYSETTARDIIYKMKKNKAAEVLSELDPVTANKIARFPGDRERQSFINN